MLAFFLSQRLLVERFHKSYQGFFLKVLQCSGGRLQTDTFSLLAAFKFRY